MPRQGAYQQDGDIIDYINTDSEIITAGQVVPLISRIGFAAADIAPGALGSVVVKGVFCDVPAVTTAAFDVGDSLFWDNTAGKLTKTATDNIPTGGWSVAAKAQAGAVAVIKLAG